MSKKIMTTDKKTIEQKYQKLSQREHVLHRPGMYIGSIAKTNEEQWVFDVTQNKMIKKFVEFSPGFLKIFDEVLTNATDHVTRDATVTTIKVDYDKKTGEISVWNNGSGIPVVLHKEHNLYVPELIFGHLLSGSNYDDNQQRVGAGTNGIGAKACSIFSKSFIIETIDSDNKKKFVQEYKENMSDKTTPKITSNSSKSYTKITFIPDYKRFGMKGLEDDTCLLINKRVYDCIACTNKNVSIYLNGEKLKGKSFSDYTKYFFDEEKYKVFYESSIQKIKGTEFIWEYAIVPHSHFEQISFVNGNATVQGGKHVDYILYQIVNRLKEMLETKKKLKDVKPSFIKDRLFLFLRTTIVNPSFNSQTKEMLTTPSKDFGCKVEVSDKFIEKIWKSSIIEDIVEFCKVKESLELSKHSVSGDTPLLLKDENNKIVIKTIDKITDDFTETENNNDYGKTNYKVWTENGWTDIIHVMRHKSSKQMYRILTHTGFVDVTEDHSLLTDKIQEISPKNCKVGDVLLHSFPEFNDNSIELNLNYKEMNSIELHNYASYLKIPYYRGTKEKIIKLIESKHIEYKNQLNITLEYDNTINYDEAWVMGLFWADGTAGIYTDKRGYTIYNFAIHNTNKKFLIKSQEIFSKIYPNEKTSIYILERDSTRQTKYQLQFNGYSKIEYIIKKYINLFYYQTNTSITGKGSKTKYGNKYVPIEILNAPKNIRSNFLNGVYCGDGRGHDINVQSIKEMSIESKISAQGIYYLGMSLGYFVSIQCREDKPNIFTLIFGTQYYNRNPNKIKKIIKLGCITEYVYDLETQNHHFHAGIGRMIVHNTDGKKKNRIFVPKLEDALWAGTAKSDQCTLILTEGLSAMTFAMWGRSVVGPEKYGCYPMKGKVLNIRDATMSQLMNNEEINNLKQIIGLQNNKDYKNTSELRYGKVMILTDADTDGSHIKGLLVNLFHCWWPSLIKLNFIQTLRTPIIKAIKGQKVVEFYTEQDYNKWKDNIGTTRGYQIRYFKGLGTSKKEDAKDTFKRFDELKVDYYYKDKGCDEAILLAFEKDKNVKSTKTDKTDITSDDHDSNETIVTLKCSDKRKRWLGQYDKDSYINIKENRISYQDLINKELIHFSIYDNMRSIPSICDGLKPSQRKILYYMLKNNITKVIKVAQLSGYVSAETGYHHGEMSLQQAIIGMAQNFVGSNNINLLYPDGNHGCLDPKTEIILWNGDVKMASEIKTGDNLIGDDGNIRTVLQITNGEDIMYRINTNNKYYIVNSEHILTLKFLKHKKFFWKESSKSWNIQYFDINLMKECLKEFRTKESSNIKLTYNKSKMSKDVAFEQAKIFLQNIQNNDIFDIKVKDFLKLPTTTQKKFRSIENISCINWKENDVPIDPYIFGTWIGNGNSNGHGITSMDEEILNNKTIPKEYILNSKENRLKLLAGIIDTDGSVKFQNGIPKIEISQSKRLRHHVIKSIELLCHSLGYQTTISEIKYDKLTKKGESMNLSVISIYGNDLHEIPIKVPRKKINPYKRIVTSHTHLFELTCIGKGKYCGWQLDGNERFLMNNFIITHNSRLNGGKDSASPRYIFTRLDDATLKIFNENDSTLLKYLNDDGTSIEPEWYVPVIPMVLVNGCEGIGTGYSTYIPPFNPKDIIANLLRVLEGKDPLKMIPYFRGFNGVVEEVKGVEGSYLTRGKWERYSDNGIKITELPVGMWVTVYKEFLESLIVDNSNKKKDTTAKKRPNKVVLKDVKNKTRDENDDICFIVEFKSSEDLDLLIKTGTLEKELKLIKTFSTNNMYLFGEDLILSKYGNPNDILLDFYDIRLDYYVARKEYMTKKLENELALLKAKVRFIEEYITGKLDINRKSREYINDLLEKAGYPKFGYENSEVKSYDYLVRMQIVSLTGEKIDELNKQRDEKQRQLDNIKSKTEKDLWKDDLQDILKMI